MASVHPSRLGLVPAASAGPSSLPARPSDVTITAAETSGSGTAASREEELKRKLLARRLQKSAAPESPSRGDVAYRSDGYRGKELFSGDSSPRRSARDDRDTPPTGLRIKGRGFRRDESPEVASGSASPLGYDRTPEASPRRGTTSRRSRQDTPESFGRPRTRSPVSRRGDSPPRRQDLRGDRHSPESRSPRRYHRQEEDRRDHGRSSSDRRDYQRDERMRGAYDRHERSRPDERESFGNGHDDRNGFRRNHTLPPRPHHDLPPHLVPPGLQNRPGPSGPPQMLPPIWMNAEAAMPPFPPNKGPTHNKGRNTPMNLEQRREEREKMTLTVWPPSPESPWRDPDEVEEERRAKRKEKKRSKKSKRKSKYSSSESDSSDSEYERRRRQRKERKRERERERERPRSKYSDEESDVDKRRERKRSKDRKRYSDDESDEDRHDKRRNRDRRRYTDELSDADRDRKRRRSKSKSARVVDTQDAETEWVEKGGDEVRDPSSRYAASSTVRDDDEDDDGGVGPTLPADLSAKDYKAHYTNMLYGEAEAMAAYAADGRRIPRRGEIGLESARIEEFEAAGYVMSGNRHKRMTAVRLRKENQVISAEEKRAILKLQREEKVRKEGAIVSQFREMLDEKLREGRKDKEGEGK